MLQISNIIDIVVVKYISSELDKKCYDNFMAYLSQIKNLNIYIHDNTYDNIGLVKARNNLIEQCRSNIVCFCDYDIMPKSIEWDKILSKLQEDNSIGIISPVTTKFSSVNRSLEWQPKTYISCNMMFMRLDTFKQLGMFDDNFFVAYADWDLVKRVQLADLKILQHNYSIIDHFGLARYRSNKGPIWRKDFATYINKWGKDGVLDRLKK